MSDKKQQHVAKTIHYRDYHNTISFPLIHRPITHKFEIFWTPKDEEWDEHYLCICDISSEYSIEPSFVGEEGNDGRMRILFKIKYLPMRKTLATPYFELEILILPVEREDGSLHLAVTSAGAQCNEDYKEKSKAELDRLIAAIENN